MGDAVVCHEGETVIGSKPSDNNISTEAPLVVDLDGTLIKTDLLYESLFGLIKQGYSFLLVPIWLIKGKAHLKNEIAKRVNLDIGVLPYNEQFLGFLREQKALGRRLVLATASNKKYADQVAGHLGLFESVESSDNRTNLSGTIKLKRLQAKYGDQGFDYAGNSNTDLKVWKYARQSIVVNPEVGVLKAFKKLGTVAQTFDDGKKGVSSYVRAMRPHQWSKNLLIFAPLVAAHEVANLDSCLKALLAFFAFSLCASSAYLLNDMLDLGADRRHERKRGRPFASGDAAIKYGAILCLAIAIIGMCVAPLLSINFLLVLGTYFISTIAYSVYYKHFVVIDVILLAGLYTIRIIAGAVAIESTPSFWLLSFAMFIFLGLAMLKRYSELFFLTQTSQENTRARGYRVSDLMQINSLGISSSYLSVLVLALYINSSKIDEYYSHPMTIWLLIPILLYWISRIWFKAGRGEVHDDPLVFTMKDRTTQKLAVISAIILFLAS